MRLPEHQDCQRRPCNALAERESGAWPAATRNFGSTCIREQEAPLYPDGTPWPSKSSAKGICGHFLCGFGKGKRVGRILAAWGFLGDGCKVYTVELTVEFTFLSVNMFYIRMFS